MKRDFTIAYPGGHMERTVVGKDGQVHHPPLRKGKDGQCQVGKHGHFTDEEEYRRAVEQAAEVNRQLAVSRSPGHWAIGPLEFDSFGLLPEDGFGRLSSEDY